MRDHFELANIFWWVVIPAGMFLTFLSYYSPECVNVPWLSFVGQLAYNLGTEHPQLLLWLNIVAWTAHLLEAIFALYLTDTLQFSLKCSMLWFVQTFVLGFPSLRLLLGIWRKEKKENK